MPQHCRTCGAEVVWITSPSGKAQIADAEERVEWVTDEPNKVSVRPIVLIERETGAIVKGYRATSITDRLDGAREIRGHVSHWATCTTPPARRR